MCGRFYVPADDMPEVMENLLRQANRTAPEPLPRGEITPGMRVASLCLSRVSREAKAFPMTWGYPMRGKLLINARSETAAERPVFRESFRTRRCLIPAAAWFEWDHRNADHTKYRLRPESLPWFFLAGLYRLGDHGAECAVLTREAEGDAASIHGRMPVTFAPEDAALWLDPDADPAALLAEPPIPALCSAEPDQSAQISLWQALEG